MTTTAPIVRPVTAEQSSAIANLEIDGTAVEVIFQSSDRAYGFDATPAFAAYLAEVISSPDLLGLSLGRLISDARRCGDLQQIPEAI